MKIIDDLKVITDSIKDSNNQSTSTNDPAKKKILIVDDEKPLADALGDAFESEGFNVLKAANGKVGLEMAITYKPQIILLDLMMPVMDGKSMLRKLRAIPQFKRLPVIVLTNAGDVNNLRETHVYYNANEFVVKSNITMDELVTKVKDWLM